MAVAEAAPVRGVAQEAVRRTRHNKAATAAAVLVTARVAGAVVVVEGSEEEEARVAAEVDAVAVAASTHREARRRLQPEANLREVRRPTMQWVTSSRKRQRNQDKTVL